MGVQLSEARPGFVFVFPDLAFPRDDRESFVGFVAQAEDGDRALGQGDGVDQLKEWLTKRRNAFGQAIRDYGLPELKACSSSASKSLTVKATASAFGLPVLKLDAGKLFGSLVGQSEANLRATIATFLTIFQP
ncbi:MAG: hypothetical protein ACR2RV_19200 [Verrucomicrobiales bacterium]